MNTSSLGAGSAAIRAAGVPHPEEHEAGIASRPVITLSREAGTKAGDVARRLVTLLNEDVPEDRRWSSYDKELIERVAKEHGLSPEEVACTDEHDEALVEQMLHGLKHATSGTSIAIKMARTIRGLSNAGRAIIVGRGGQAILARRPGAVHVRLIAPEPWRAVTYAAEAGVEPRAALKAVRKIDSDRSRFVKAHFHANPADPTLYTVMLNMSRTTIDRAADVIARFVQPPGSD